MSIEAAEATTVSRPRRGSHSAGPAGRPDQPAPRVRSPRGPAACGPVGGVSCAVVRPGSRFAQRLKSMAFAALVVLSFVVAAPGIASLNQPDPTSTPTVGDPAWAHVTGR